MHVRVHCFKNGFSELAEASSPQTSPGLIVLESMVEGSLSTVIPRPSLNRALLHLWPLPIVHNFGNV